MRRGERDVEWRCAGGGGGEGEAPRAGGDSAAVEQRRLAAAAAGERLYGEEGAGRRRALQPQPAVSLPAAVPDLFGECTEVRAGEMVSRRSSEHCANTRTTNAASAAEYGRMRRETCPLERQLEWMSSYSASRHEICGDTGRYGEIWGDTPLLGRQTRDAPPARPRRGASLTPEEDAASTSPGASSASKKKPRSSTACSSVSASYTDAWVRYTSLHTHTQWGKGRATLASPHRRHWTRKAQHVGERCACVRACVRACACVRALLSVYLSECSCARLLVQRRPCRGPQPPSLG